MCIRDRGKTVSLCALTDEAFLDFLCSDAFEKRAFDAKPLYRAALDAGREAANITLDAKLAAYLLNPSARGYDIAALEAEYLSLIHISARSPSRSRAAIRTPEAKTPSR